MTVETQIVVVTADTQIFCCDSLFFLCVVESSNGYIELQILSCMNVFLFLCFFQLLFIYTFAIPTLTIILEENFCFLVHIYNYGKYIPL